MEAYPDDYITHNLPLVVLSGLENASATTPSSSPDGFDFGRGTRITSDLPCLSGSRAEHLLSEFMKADGTLFPDGVLSPHWVAKHQHHVPSVFISFFEINADPSSSSLQDNHLKNDINAIKTALTKSGFKTRYAVVLLSDKSLSAAPELEERLAALRRATSLDSKTSLFFLPPNGSRTELASFVTNVLVALQPVCIEYYRDLTKHARRKKNRGYVPPPTAAPTRGTSQTLSTQGWNVRYEFKQGVFAEFRQEMDVAERHYSFAIEELFNPEGVFETTPSWSPRWDEARLLCDVIALRVLRCQLWRE
ncbi:hypothetical protein H2203_002873 [Taxawa tesnikishii (nom. ined.)]|nr:hypothetical protein H2203_002873 [Dothideales sp. JES 119]